LDATAAARPHILVSAGRRGLQLELDPAELVRLTDATVASIARPG
jgi:Cys-tRNA(Pro)/Cys-tRNA(Cys) deacylase